MVNSPIQRVLPARVAMGLHGYSEDLERALSSGRLRLGGCMITYDIDTGHSTDPERYCNDCGTAWGRWVGPQCQWPAHS